MSMSVDGLVSGMDTTSLVAQLLRAEGAPQAALRSRLSATQLAASAYRTVNTTFATLRSAADALTTASLTAGRKATTNNPSVTASATAAAVPGTSVTFSVTALSATHTIVSNSEWASTSADVRTDASGNPQEPAWPIEIRNASGAIVGSPIDLPAGATLADAVTAINAANAGVKAAAIKVGDNRYRLQVTSTTSGAAGAFLVKSATETETSAGSGFLVTKSAQDATLDLGGGLIASSANNTFTDLMPGVSVTVSKADGTTPVTLTVDHDTDGAAAKMQALVDGVNGALDAVRTYTNSSPGSTAALKGEFALTSLGSQLLSAVSSTVGPGGSPAQVGLQLTRDGKVTFDKAKFLTALKDTPDLAQRVVGGQVAGPGPNKTAGDSDDVVAAPGIAQRLLDVAKAASDSTIGSITALANGQDTLAKDIQNRIAAWDLRLVRRKEALTRQFTAMETALSGLRNQSTWLAGQINGLPR